MLYDKILKAHDLKDIKAFEEILHDDFVYMWGERVENRRQWPTETPKMWEQGIQLNKQTLIMENEDLLVTEHPDADQGFRDKIVRILQSGEVIKRYVTRLSL